MDITDILSKAEKGDLEFCRECPWSPRHDRNIGYGISCIEHGIDWNVEKKVNSMLIVQDPGDTTPHHTGRLCVVHNAKNPSDRTAQHNIQLWNAAVSLKKDAPDNGGYLKRHYWTNAIMHGASKNTGLRENSIMKAARDCCSNVLALQIHALQPNVVIACGTDAVDSLHKIGILKQNWSSVRHRFTNGAYCEDVVSWRGLPPFKAFCTYHTAARVVNQTLSRSYDPVVTEHHIGEKTKQLGSPESIDRFLSAYGDKEKSRDRGMRYLLNHWLDIGIAIRANAGEKN